MEGAGAIIVAPPCWVRERVVGVVYQLESLGAGGPLGGVSGDAIRVVLECGSGGILGFHSGVRAGYLAHFL